MNNDTGPIRSAPGPALLQFQLPPALLRHRHLHTVVTRPVSGTVASPPRPASRRRSMHMFGFESLRSTSLRRVAEFRQHRHHALLDVTGSMDDTLSGTRRSSRARRGDGALRRAGADPGPAHGQRPSGCAMDRALFEHGQRRLPAAPGRSQQSRAAAIIDARRELQHAGADRDADHLLGILSRAAASRRRHRRQPGDDRHFQRQLREVQPESELHRLHPDLAADQRRAGAGDDLCDHLPL